MNNHHLFIENVKQILKTCLKYTTTQNIDLWMTQNKYIYRLDNKEVIPETITAAFMGPEAEGRSMPILRIWSNF